MNKNFHESLEQCLQNPEFKKEWDYLEDEFKKIKELVAHLPENNEDIDCLTIKGVSNNDNYHN